jgi:hypothetical protein
VASEAGLDGDGTKRGIFSLRIPRHRPRRPPVWRILSTCHDIRNLGEYEGDLNVDQRIVVDLIAACERVAAKVDALGPAV